MPQTYTELIFNSSSPWDNPFQGQDKKVLFICSAGILRSATGARMYASKYNTRAAGSAEYALIPVTGDLLIWADEIVFVNEENQQAVAKKFDLDSLKAKIKVLNIPDCYPHMHSGLQDQFKKQYEEL